MFPPAKKVDESILSLFLENLAAGSGDFDGVAGVNMWAAEAGKS